MAILILLDLLSSVISHILVLNVNLHVGLMETCDYLQMIYCHRANRRLGDWNVSKL